MSFYVIESVDSEVIKFKFAIPKVTDAQYSTWRSGSGTTKTSTWHNTGGVITCDGFTMTDASFVLGYMTSHTWGPLYPGGPQGINELLLSSGAQNTFNDYSLTNKGWNENYYIPLTNNFSFQVMYGNYSQDLFIKLPSSSSYWSSANLYSPAYFWTLVYANNTLYIAKFFGGTSTGTRFFDFDASGSVAFYSFATDSSLLSEFLNSGEQSYRFTTRIAFDDNYLIAPERFNYKTSQQLTFDMLNIVYDGSPFCEIHIENLQVQLPSMFQPSKGKRLGTFLAINNAFPSQLHFEVSNHSNFLYNIFDNIEYIAPSTAEFTTSNVDNANYNFNFSFYRNALDTYLTPYKSEWRNSGTLGLRMNIISDQALGSMYSDKYWSGPFLYPSNYAFVYPDEVGEYIPCGWDSLNFDGQYTGILLFNDLITNNIILATAKLIPSQNNSTNGRIHLEFQTVNELIPNGSMTNGNIALVSYAEPEPYDRPDPYETGGTSGEGGGTDSTYTRPNENVPVPAMPSLSPVATKFISVFSPTLSQLNDFASFLWSDAFSVPTLKKIFTNPIDLVLGASIVPVTPDTDTVAQLVFGGFDSGVSMNHVSSIYKDVDCGTLQVKPFWDNFIDYSPYTKLSIFLPFVGVHELLIDDFMKHTISVKYRINVLSGACIAYIIQDSATNPKVLYQFSGNCTTNIPITEMDYSQNIFSSIITATTIATSIAAIGVGATTGAGTVAGAAMTASGVAGLASSVKNVASLKPSYHRASGVAGENGLLGIRIPYLIYEAYQQSLPQSLNKYNGLPINATYTLRELKGFTQVKYIRLNSVPATSEEIDEIVSLLKEGVIL